MSPNSWHRQVIFLSFMVGNSMKWQSLWVKFFFRKLASLCISLKKGLFTIFPFCPHVPSIRSAGIPCWLFWHATESPVYHAGLPAVWTLIFHWAVGIGSQQQPIQTYCLKERGPHCDKHQWSGPSKWTSSAMGDATLTAPPVSHFSPCMEHNCCL